MAGRLPVRAQVQLYRLNQPYQLLMDCSSDVLRMTALPQRPGAFLLEHADNSIRLVSASCIARLLGGQTQGFDLGRGMCQDAWMPQPALVPYASAAEECPAPACFTPRRSTPAPRAPTRRF